MKISLLHFFLLIAAACLAAPAVLSVPAPTGAKLTFRRVFKGSSPELIEITVREDSDAAAYEIRQLDEDPGSLPFRWARLGATRCSTCRRNPSTYKDWIWMCIARTPIPDKK